MTRAGIEALIADCPFHRHLGVTVAAIDAGAGVITLSLDIRPEFSRSGGRAELHGGIIATLIDIAGDYAVALRLGQGVPTISLNVDYLRFARGARATATARLVKCGRSIAVATVEVADETGQIVAVGRGTYATAGARTPEAG
jgi:uncharacterized protein (TIGR00369 family)